LTLRGVLSSVKSRVKTALGWILARVLMWLGGMRSLLSFTHHWAISKESSSRFVRLSRRTNPAFLILGYHRVSDEPHPFFGGLPVRIFRRHMEHLKTYFTPLPLKELVERAASGDVPPNAIAVTFDDGYRDNYQNAFPVLVQFEMPATVFLATSAVEANKPLWHDRVFEAFRLTSANFLIWKGEALAMTNDTEVEFVLERVLEYLRTCSPAKRDEVILDLEQKLRVDLSSEDFLPKLDWNEVRRMYERNITFGAHTVSHPILSRMPLDDAVREIRLSKEVIEKQLGTSIELFAYPNGRHEDFTDQIKEALRTEGFACAVTTMHGINDASTDPFELRRLSHTDGDAKLWGLQLGLYRFVG